MAWHNFYKKRSKSSEEKVKEELNKRNEILSKKFDEVFSEKLDDE